MRLAPTPHTATPRHQLVEAGLLAPTIELADNLGVIDANDNIIKRPPKGGVQHVAP